MIPSSAVSETAAGARTSSFGVYRGFSEPRYDGYSRLSRYVAVRDGTRLAADVYLPTIGGNPAGEPVPVVWTHHRYRRAFRDAAIAGMLRLEPDALVTVLDVIPGLRTLLRHGYAVAAVDVRGSGASFGSWRGIFSSEETRDAHDVTEWLAGEPWCDGSVGMFGLAYLGITQYMAASTAPPHLKAIFPEVSALDLYSAFYPGGVFREDLLRTWSSLSRQMDEGIPAAPVDEDPDGRLLAQARAGHAENRDVHALYSSLRCRDAEDPETGARPYLD